MPNPGELGPSITSRRALAEAINQESTVYAADLPARLRTASLWTVGSALPGCLPDSPPAIYPTLREARAALAEERRACQGTAARAFLDSAPVSDLLAG